MSQVIYARVPDTLKDAMDAYREGRGVTLTAAVVDLLQRGLAASTDAPSVAGLESRLGALKAEKAATEAQLKAARSEGEALEALMRRVRQKVGLCPEVECGHAITGYDLLATGSCPACHNPLSQLLLGPRLSAPDLNQASKGLNDRDFLLLLGAIGAVVGVAYLRSKS